MELYSMEREPSAQLVHIDQVVFLSNMHLASIPLNLSYHLPVKICFSLCNCTSLYQCFWQPFLCTSHPLCGYCSPQIPFKNVPSHLKTLPSNFRCPYPKKKSVTIHLFCALILSHDFIDLYHHLL